MKHIVGVSDMKVISDRHDTIVTHALGSCIGIAVMDIQAGVAGMLHYMLPWSKSDPERSKTRPLMYGDLAIPMLFKAVYSLGASKQNLRVVMAGGSQLFGKSDLFEIGKRNVIIARKLLWKNDILLAAESVGGSAPRTLHLDLSEERTWISSDRKTIPL